MLKRTPVLLAAIALVAAACASSQGAATTSSQVPPDPTTTSSMVEHTTTTTTTPTSPAFPVTVTADNGDVTIEDQPQRIVSLSPTSTEILFAIGAGGAVVAVDSLSNYPPEAPLTDLSSWTPNVEAIASYDPDVVFLSFDPGDTVSGLEAIGIPVIVHGTAFSLGAAYDQWEQTGAVTGNVAEAAVLVADAQTGIDGAIATVGDSGDGITYYYEIDNTFYTATSSSFIGQLFAPMGVVNIADEADDPGGFGFPQLSPEYIVDSDPALILLADARYSGESASTVAERPGWDTLTAVSTGSVVELDDDVASRWGPRIVELVEAVAQAINKLVAANA